MNQQAVDIAKNIESVAISFKAQGSCSLSFDVQKAAELINVALAEREAQAVQREREAARRERETLIGVFEGTIKNMQAALATYNDNSKG